MIAFVKAVILAGGLGTRISEETDNKPKPMVEIGGFPMIWHIMKIYSSYGINDFVICCGYKGYVIKEYFSNYFLHMSDVTFDMSTNEVEFHRGGAENWRVTLIDTGQNTMTGGRLKRVMPYLRGEKSFCFTYGDGVSNVDIGGLIASHHESGGLATMTCVFPPARFGALEIANGRVESFKEKPIGEGGRINGGFFVVSPEVESLLIDDSTVWEQGPLEQLANDGRLIAFSHDGFWQPMDTLRDKLLLDRLWISGEAPWKIW